MERSLTKKPHEKDKAAPSLLAGTLKRPGVGHKSRAAAASASATRHSKEKERLERKSATAQAVKKLAQSERSESSRVRDGSRSVNYLSSTTASRAKAASVAQIHKPSVTLSVGKLVENASVKSEGSLKSRRPKSANNNKDLDGDKSQSALSHGRGKSRSQATFKSTTHSLGRKSLRHQKFSKEKDKKVERKSSVDKDLELGLEKKTNKSSNKLGSGGSSSPTITSSNPGTTDSPIGSKHSSKGRYSGEKKMIRVSMNKTSELRAAMHRPTVKRSTTSKSETSKSSKKSYKALGRESKSKKRPRKRPSSDSASSKQNSGSPPASILRT
ncbi:unnamed protein product [Allacma fusca]|uniref:Uncharacterized protein n=1 Tax=Allacma fusca TaxID=39272 RepID=A0A8J2JM73_9HEXA|nr:unnamed protein product [Allacma fusca]